MKLLDNITPARRKKRARRRKRSVRQWRDEMLQEDPHCWFCGLELVPGNATFDHFVPHCRGGETSRINGVLACNACNETKSDLPAELLLCRLQRGAGVIRIWEFSGVQLIPIFFESTMCETSNGDGFGSIQGRPPESGDGVLPGK